jgi:LuxR family maltose regulon positive regulatory protein
MNDQVAESNDKHSSFLATKLFIPRSNSRQVQRPFLIDRLNAFHDHKMTLVSAPAGFGKTTILTQWVSQLNDPVAWLSLDEKDNDPYLFLQYLIAALQSVDSSLGVTAAHALQTVKKQALAAILIPLLNDISKKQNQLFVILDDYHCIQSDDRRPVSG